MVYVLSALKALALVWTVGSSQPTISDLRIGQPALCPNQIEGLDDEEDNCRVIAVSEQAGIVILASEDMP